MDRLLTGLHKSLGMTFQTAWENMPDDFQSVFVEVRMLCEV